MVFITSTLTSEIYKSSKSFGKDGPCSSSEPVQDLVYLGFSLVCVRDGSVSWSSSSSGHKWKQGMWSKEEIDILMSNIDRYVKVRPGSSSRFWPHEAEKLKEFWFLQGRGIQDPAEIIFEMSKEERKDFYRSVALGLNRPLFAVYRRVLRMYDNRNHVGKWVREKRAAKNQTSGSAVWAEVCALCQVHARRDREAKSVSSTSPLF